MVRRLRGVRLATVAFATVTLASGCVSRHARAADVTASPPRALSVTVYRDPGRREGADLALDELEGFALIAETRTVFLPAGDSRLRFPGVADGIEAPSAILTGLPFGVLEKNRDAQVLSPGALVAATLNRQVTLVRTNRKTGRVTRIRGRLRSDNGGVVFESSEGIEALRCSGLPEAFQFDSTADLAPTPTLSVRAASERPLAAQVTLSYLARGFDWAANYTATLSPDARTLSLGAWVTLANGNSVSFPDSSVAVVAGRLHREADEPEPFDAASSAVAQCWPRQTTSDIPDTPAPPREGDQPGELYDRMAMVVVDAEQLESRAFLTEEEQLGDLKLYRVPWRTSLNAAQMKQVRLLDRGDVPVELLHVAELAADEQTEVAPARRVLRTMNDSAHRLGIPLPAGRVDTFIEHDGTPLLLKQTPLRDIAVGEELEIAAGEALDVQVGTVREKTTINPSRVRELPLLPGVVHLRRAVRDEVWRIEIENASSRDIVFEARLRLPDGTQLIGARPAPFLRDGRQILSLRIASGDRAVMRYRTEHIHKQVVPPR
jgi:hypothetical protein